MDYLMAALESEWGKRFIEYITGLVDSMPKRCAARLRAKDYATKH